MAIRKRDYLFKRDGSQYWRVRFQMGGRSVEQSLKTTDRREAELAALPMIAEHKAKLLAMRPRLNPLGEGISARLARGPRWQPPLRDRTRVAPS